MGLTVVVVCLAAIGGWLTGGRLRRIRGHRLRSPAIALAACSVLFCEPLLGADVPHAYPGALVVSALLFAQFAVRNLRVPGVLLAALGLALNAAVVVANGSMPVEPTAASRAGVGAIPAGADQRHVLAGPATRLHQLDDRVAVPLPGHREVDSLGDVALAAGLGLCVFTALRRRETLFIDAPPRLLQRA